MREELPKFVAPMLATPGIPFDADDHLFEIKWDGLRALAFRDRDGVRLRGRRGADLHPRFPELSCLADIEPGLVLDGEIVLLREGRPDFPAVMSRAQARAKLRIEGLARTIPATYVAFDLLYDRFETVMDRDLAMRRRLLSRLVPSGGAVVVSEGVVGAGRRYFEETSRLGFEGIVAKRLASPYRPGKRTGDWTKIKRAEKLQCAILGYVPDGDDDLKSLILAAESEGRLRSVGRVGSGLTRAMRSRLLGLFRSRAAPFVPTEEKGRWIEPGLYCVVSTFERTSSGGLRGPVFLDLLPE